MRFISSILAITLALAGCGDGGTASDGGIDAQSAIDAQTGVDAFVASDAFVPDDAFVDVDSSVPDDAFVPTDAFVDLDATPPSDGGEPTVNGCDRATATDLTGMSATTITFGGSAGLVYDPPCIRVSVGTTVTFTGQLSIHPLQAGTVAGTTTTPAAAGTTPLPTTALSSGTSATFTMAPAGTYPYYCAAHALAGMRGVIYAE